MIFNSLTFLIFFTVFFLLYWFVTNKNLIAQNLLILAGSYFFYAWWDWRFLFLLIIFSTLIFGLGLSIEKSKTIPRKRLFLITGLILGIGELIYFKYMNFFITSLNSAFNLANINISLVTLNIIVPLGISFFTFRAISYLLDIEKGKIKASNDFIAFFIYMSFFPSVFSGPIDKARTFMPQLEKKRMFEYSQAADGMYQILWGLFKKVVIADNCAPITYLIFNDFENLPGSTLLMGAFLFTIQIYADFSGYSDMAIGISRLLGFNITRNFDFPFFAQNIADFWRKWHISLTTWLTEYVFTPLTIAFRDYGNTGLILAILINFILIGLWHGPAWTYVIFGFLHGCYYIPLILKGTINKKKKIAKNKILPSLQEFINALMTFTLVMLTFVIFRADTITQAFRYYAGIFSLSLFTIPEINYSRLSVLTTFLLICIMLIVEWLQREKEHGFQFAGIKSRALKLSICYACIILIILLGATSENPFIYFKF